MYPDRKTHLADPKSSAVMSVADSRSAPLRHVRMVRWPLQLSMTHRPARSNALIYMTHRRRKKRMNFEVGEVHACASLANTELADIHRRALQAADKDGTLLVLATCSNLHRVVLL